MTHHLFGTTEPAAVAELGPHRHRDQAADPILRVDQRPTCRLAGTEALQLPLEGLRLEIGRVDHPIPGCDPLPRRRRQTADVSSASIARVLTVRIAPSGTATPW